jgi:hypothetical protein
MIAEIAGLALLSGLPAAILAELSGDNDRKLSTLAKEAISRVRGLAAQSGAPSHVVESPIGQVGQWLADNEADLDPDEVAFFTSHMRLIEEATR